MRRPIFMMLIPTATLAAAHKVTDVLIWCKGDSRLEQCSGAWPPL